MTSVVFYFQVHQPFRLRRDYNFFKIGSDHSYEDEHLNAEILRKVAVNCYLPANRLMLDQINKHKGKFKIAFRISGIALVQFENYAPDVLHSFKMLVDTGCVELLSETYYHSLSFLYSEKAFKEEVKKHKDKIKEIAKKYKDSKSIICIGRNSLEPIAKEIALKILSILFLAMTLFSESRGVVDRDIDFKTYVGKEHNLHDLLNSGMHIYLITYKYPF